MELCHPFDLFERMLDGRECVSDMADGLTEEEEAFVRGNVSNFCETYRPETASSSNGLDDPTVAALAAQGDSAMQAGDFERAVALYEEAKAERATLATRPAQHGRRAGQSPAKSSGRIAPIPRDGPVVCVSTPTRRLQAPSGLSRREEVAARVASRK